MSRRCPVTPPSRDGRWKGKCGGCRILPAAARFCPPRLVWAGEETAPGGCQGGGDTPRTRGACVVTITAVPPPPTPAAPLGRGLVFIDTLPPPAVPKWCLCPQHVLSLLVACSALLCGSRRGAWVGRGAGFGGEGGMGTAVPGSSACFGVGGGRTHAIGHGDTLWGTGQRTGCGMGMWGSQAGWGGWRCALVGGWDPQPVPPSPPPPQCQNTTPLASCPSVSTPPSPGYMTPPPGAPPAPRVPRSPTPAPPFVPSSP